MPAYAPGPRKFRGRTGESSRLSLIDGGSSSPHCAFTRSVPCFTAMTDCQQHDLLAVISIQHNVGSLPEFHDPLTELRWKLIDRTTNLRIPTEQLQASADRLDGTARSIAILRRKKIVKASEFA